MKASYAEMNNPVGPDRVSAEWQKTAIRFWNDFADQYDKYYQGGHINRENRTIGQVLRHHMLEGAILDIGCGTGGLLHVIDDAIVAYRGLDAAGEMIKHARAKFPWFEFSRWDVDTEGIPGGYRNIISMFSWNYLNNPEYVIEQIKGALRPGRVFIAVLYNRNRRQHDYPAGNVPKRYYSDSWFRRWFDHVESYPFRVTGRYLWPALEDGVIARIFPRLAVYRIVICSST